jgi:hypothetical protein
MATNAFHAVHAIQPGHPNVPDAIPSTFKTNRVLICWKANGLQEPGKNPQVGFFSGLPAMGVYRYKDSATVTNAVPGMIMTLDKSGYHGNAKSGVEFFRLFAPSKPHTITAIGRSCKSCHNDPNALGYGRGKLTFVADAKKPHWEFESTYADAEDGLPADAWIPFLGERKNKVSTRLNFTPFTLAEQQRILTVGACLTCHKEDSELMINSLQMDFTQLKSNMTARCKEPVFKLKCPAEAGHFLVHKKRKSYLLNHFCTCIARPLRHCTVKYFDVFVA